MPTTIRVIAADPHPVALAGIDAFFTKSGATLVAQTISGEETIAKTLELQPDVLLLETKFYDISGFEVAALLRAKGFQGKIVFFSTSDRQTHLARAIAAGADSYLFKSVTRDELMETVNALGRQGANKRRKQSVDLVETLGLYSGELRRAAPLMRRRSADPLNPLTSRETQILRHITLGLSNKEIAASLQLSLDTIKEHVQNILRKLDVDDRTQAAVWAVRNKLVS